MLQIPFEKAVTIISERTKQPKEDVLGLIEAKLKEFSGLISREGAAHVVANDLGINLLDIHIPLKINEISDNQKSTHVTAKVLQTYDQRTFERNGSQGRVQSVLLGDETGVMRLTFWNDQADLLVDVKPQDILQLNNVAIRKNQDRVELTFGSVSKMLVNPPGVEIEVVNRSAQAASVKIIDIADQGVVEIMGVIVQAYKPSFYPVDKLTNKKVRLDETNQFDPEKHTYAYVLNVVVDDGSETIRCVAFRDQVAQIFDLTHDGVLELKEHEKLFETHHAKILGSLVQLTGRVTKNEMFARNELIIQSLSFNPDPK
ncbi:MAG: hypothetical protein ACI8Y7_000088 [Candidatus Woesearchaeota archaeon]|jgi:hypothetical protein